MSIQWGNPIVITSGHVGLLESTSGLGMSRIKVRHAYWLGPTLESTSGVRITKYGTSSPYLQMAAEVSGQSQVVKVDQWWNNAYVEVVATGTLFIYCH